MYAYYVCTCAHMHVQYIHMYICMYVCVHIQKFAKSTNLYLKNFRLYTYKVFHHAINFVGLTYDLMPITYFAIELLMYIYTKLA